jgi:catechol 2,3-dioxygenase-like lactoylglutathione lyase family enzyme
VTIKGVQCIDIISIYITDLARAITFYEALGFAKTFENQRGCTMVTEDGYGRLAALSIPDTANQSASGGTRVQFVSASTRHRSH